jgi:hypothetical protein
MGIVAQMRVHLPAGKSGFGIRPQASDLDFSGETLLLKAKRGD